MRKNGRTFFYEKNKSVIFAYVMMLCVFVLYVASQPNFFSAYGVKSTFDQFQPLVQLGNGYTGFDRLGYGFFGNGFGCRIGCFGQIGC